MIKPNPIRNAKDRRRETKISNGARILVVDNDKDICWLIASILKEEDFCVDIAHDVKSALAKINHHQYEVMVLDYKLSGMSGLTPLETTEHPAGNMMSLTGLTILEKALQIKPLIVTIMISAFGNELVRAKAMEFGAYAFLDKPFNIDRLKKTVKKALTEQRFFSKRNSKVAKEPKGCGENFSPRFRGNSEAELRPSVIGGVPTRKAWVGPFEERAEGERQRRCVNEANGYSKHSRFSSDEHFGFTGFGSASGSSTNGSKDRYPIHIGAS